MRQFKADTGRFPIYDRDRYPEETVLAGSMMLGGREVNRLLPGFADVGERGDGDG